MMPPLRSPYARSFWSLSVQERRLLCILARLSQPSDASALWQAAGAQDWGSLRRLVQKQAVLQVSRQRYRVASAGLRAWLLRHRLLVPAPPFIP